MLADPPEMYFYIISYCGECGAARDDFFYFVLASADSVEMCFYIQPIAEIGEPGEMISFILLQQLQTLQR